MKWFLILLMLSGNALACWNMTAALSVGKDVMKIDQKLDHDKTYSFPSGKLIYHVKIVSDKNKPAGVPKKAGTHLVVINVDEKTGATLKEVATGMMLVNSGQEATMTKEDEKTGETSKFIIKVTEI